ncbi:hypothetical protein [uncultured Roseobacter sp.]|uniref:hypothetical protein n=1 Tax=uncultured Roseobacter sp. TaxID=114847 RepID=UPI002622CD7E|nr:hypothetical protein [uncultured Roseobacter sp.]
MFGKKFHVVPSVIAATVLLSACAQTGPSVTSQDAQLQNVLTLIEREECRFDPIDYRFTADILNRDDGDELLRRLIENCPELEVSFLTGGAISTEGFNAPEEDTPRARRVARTGGPDTGTRTADAGTPSGGGQPSGTGETPGGDTDGPGDDGGENEGPDNGNGGSFGGGNGGSFGGGNNGGEDDTGSGSGSGGNGTSGNFAG